MPIVRSQRAQYGVLCDGPGSGTVQGLAARTDRQAVKVGRRFANQAAEVGFIGDSKPVGDGAFESRIDFGPGYRIYYGVNGDTDVVLLCGGDKKTQNSDIADAKLFLADHKARIWQKKKN